MPAPRRHRGDVLLFLHADTRAAADDADGLVLDGLRRYRPALGPLRRARSRAGSPLLGVVAGLMNWRSRITGIATGDQAMFVTRDAFDAAGGFPDIPLMEDIALSKRLKRVGRPLCLARTRDRPRAGAWTSAARSGPILLMWRLRLAYWLGADPAALARRYGYVPREG